MSVETTPCFCIFAYLACAIASQVIMGIRSLAFAKRYRQPHQSECVQNGAKLKESKRNIFLTHSVFIIQRNDRNEREHSAFKKMGTHLKAPLHSVSLAYSILSQNIYIRINVFALVRACLLIMTAVAVVNQRMVFNFLTVPCNEYVIFLFVFCISLFNITSNGKSVITLNACMLGKN